MTDQTVPTTTQTIATGPLVQVVFGADSLHYQAVAPVFPFSDLALPNDDAATISDDDLIARVARWMDLPASDFSGMKARRPATGNIVLVEAPSYGVA